MLSLCVHWGFQLVSFSFCLGHLLYFLYFRYTSDWFFQFLSGEGLYFTFIFKIYFPVFSFLPFSILKISVHYFVAYVVFNLQSAVLFIFIPLHITCLYVPPVVVFHIFSFSLTLSFLIMMCLSFLHVFCAWGSWRFLDFFVPMSLFGQIWGWGRALHLKEGVGAFGSEAWSVLSIHDLWGRQELDLGVVELLDHWLAMIFSMFMIWVGWAYVLYWAPMSW